MLTGQSPLSSCLLRDRMKDMSTLPSQDTSAQSVPVQPASGAAGKEIEPVSAKTETNTLSEIGQEIFLPQEVKRAGVTIKSESIDLPAALAQSGVKAVGSPVHETPGSSITLPLSEEQVANGLHQSISSSFRWLAEWCKRQMIEAHKTLKTIHAGVTGKAGI